MVEGLVGPKPCLAELSSFSEICLPQLPPSSSGVQIPQSFRQPEKECYPFCGITEQVNPPAESIDQQADTAQTQASSASLGGSSAAKDLVLQI